LLLHANGFVVSYLLPAADIGVMALSVIAAVVLGAVVLRVETKLELMTTTMPTTRRALHSAVQSLSEGGQGQGQ
jgi:hypothetical protein